MPKFIKFILGLKLVIFPTVPLSIIRSFFYCTHSNVICHTGLLTACEQAVSKPVWHIPLMCVHWKTDDGQRNCRKYVEFHSKNKFEKLVHLVGFIIRKGSTSLGLLPLGHKDIAINFRNVAVVLFFGFQMCSETECGHDCFCCFRAQLESRSGRGDH
jgi:hypothetical protein